MPKDTQYLRLRRQTYFVQLAVPTDLRPRYSTTRIEVTTGTDSPSAAVEERDRLLVEYRREFRALRENPSMTPADYRKQRDKVSISADLIAKIRSGRMTETFGLMHSEPWRDEGDLESRKFLTSDGADDNKLEALLVAEGIAPTAEIMTSVRNAMYEADMGAEKLFRAGQRPALPRASIPLDKYRDDWLAAPSGRRKRPKAARTKNEFGYALDSLIAWLKSEGMDATVETVTHAVARSFSKHLEKTKKSPVTANKLLSGLSSYWRYLSRDQHVSENPWSGKWLAVPDKKESEKRRPFSTEEMLKLFKAADGPMRDLCAMGLLTAARREELFMLTPSHIDGDILHLPGTKTEESDRLIPIHPLLKPILTRLSKSKGKHDFLLDAPERTNEARPRGDSMGKKFGRLKTQLFGKNKTLAFHCWRHTLSQLFEKAGVPEATAARMTGHSTRLGITYGVYSKADIPVLRAALLKIKLPREVEAIIRAN